MNLREVMEALKLEPLVPEGGYFRRTFESPVTVETLQGPRCIGTSIYYLVTPESASKMHTLKSFEIYHYYAGDPLTLVLLEPDGGAKKVRLGINLAAGEVPQYQVSPGIWQGAFLENPKEGFSLVGTTCFPGFEYEDFELAHRDDLLARFPAYEHLWRGLV